MNVLVYDPSRTLTALSKAFFLGRRHRVSVSPSEEDARQKLHTALFDLLFVCSGDLPSALEADLQTDYAHVTVIHAGAQKTIPTSYPVYAQLPAPFSGMKFHRVMESLEIEVKAEEKTFDIPVDLAAGSEILSCRATRASASAFVLEGPPESFAPFLESHNGENFTATLRQGGEECAVSAEVIFEGGRWAGLRCRTGSIQSLLEKIA